MKKRFLLILGMTILFGAMSTGCSYAEYSAYEDYFNEIEEKQAGMHEDFEEAKENYYNPPTVVYNGETMTWAEYVNALSPFSPENASESSSEIEEENEE